MEPVSKPLKTVKPTLSVKPIPSVGSTVSVVGDRRFDTTTPVSFETEPLVKEFIRTNRSIAERCSLEHMSEQCFVEAYSVYHVLMDKLLSGLQDCNRQSKISNDQWIGLMTERFKRGSDWILKRLFSTDGQIVFTKELNDHSSPEHRLESLLKLWPKESEPGLCVSSTEPSIREIMLVPPPSKDSNLALSDLQTVIVTHNMLTSQQMDAVRKWTMLPSITVWNNMLACRLNSLSVLPADTCSKFDVSKYRTETKDVWKMLYSVRLFAMLHTALYDAFVLSKLIQRAYDSFSPVSRIPGFVPFIEDGSRKVNSSDQTFENNNKSYVSEHCAQAAAACVVLSALFPSEQHFFRLQAEEACSVRLWGGTAFPTDIKYGYFLGERVGTIVLEKYRKDDLIGPLFSKHLAVTPNSCRTQTVDTLSRMANRVASLSNNSINRSGFKKRN